MASQYENEEARIQQAILCVRDVKNVKISLLAREFDVPYQRLRARLAGRGLRDNCGGGGKLLDEVQEKVLISYLQKMKDTGIYAKQYMLDGIANWLLAEEHKAADPTTPPPTIGVNWSTRWLKRHPEWKAKKMQPLDLNRLNAEDVNVLTEWYLQFYNAMAQFGILPSDLYNFDETGFRIDIGRRQKILTSDSQTTIYIPDSGNRDFVTSIETICADGSTIPPFIIVEGSNIPESWVQQRLSHGTMLAVSPTDYSNNELAVDFIKHFHKHTSKRQRRSKRMLLFDGVDHHLTFEFIQYC